MSLCLTACQCAHFFSKYVVFGVYGKLLKAGISIMCSTAAVLKILALKRGLVNEPENLSNFPFSLAMT